MEGKLINFSAQSGLGNSTLIIYPDEIEIVIANAERTINAFLIANNA